MAVLRMRRRRPRVDAGGRARRPWRAAVAGAALLLCGASHSGSAKTPEVEVDLGALDSLPPPAGEPSRVIHLHPPVIAPQHPAATAPRSRAAATAPAKPAPRPAKAAAAEPEAPVPIPDPSRIPPPPHLAAAPPPPPPPAPSGPTAEAPAAVPTKTVAAIPEHAPDRPGATAPAPAAETVAQRLLFAAAATDLPADAKAELHALAKRLNADPHLYVQLLAYAGGEGDASQARRISLSRALAARSYLVDQGVDVNRVDIRPLGNRTEPGLPPDRVDLVTAER
ncbi:MAG TPA: OmpA family protein [Stellaceae bacterium]|nr:OmpA family protein [Stellaceae bacterium]